MQWNRLLHLKSHCLHQKKAEHFPNFIFYLWNKGTTDMSCVGYILCNDTSIQVFIHQTGDIHSMRCMSRQAICFLHFMWMLEYPAHVLGIFPERAQRSHYSFSIQKFFSHVEFLLVPPHCSKHLMLLHHIPIWCLSFLQTGGCCWVPVVTINPFMQSCQPPNCFLFHCCCKLNVGSLFAFLFSVPSCNFSRVF